MLAHSKAMRTEAKGCATVRPLVPLTWQAVDETVSSKIEKDRAQRPCRGTRKTGLDRFYRKMVFREEKLVECSLLKELELTDGMVLRRKAKIATVTWVEATQQAVIAISHRRVKYYEG